MMAPDTQIGWVVRKKIIGAIRYRNCRKFDRDPLRLIFAEHGAVAVFSCPTRAALAQDRLLEARMILALCS